MRTLLVSVACATLMAPVVAAADSAAVIAKAVKYHLGRTQPFFAAHHIVSATTSSASRPGETLLVSEVISDPVIARQVKESGLEGQELSTLLGTDVENVVDLSNYGSPGKLDWRRIATAYPEAKVMFEISRPLFDSSMQNAVVRLDGTNLRGPNAGHSFSLLYALRTAQNEWQVTQFVAPCCGPRAAK